jgi:predicted anti-sigma-YlaC factor YlaD
MNCKKVRDLIFCDYTDNEATPKVKSKVEEHLKICPACRQFQEDLQKAGVLPFTQAQNIQPPEYLWYRIKETIVSKKEPQRLSIFTQLDSLRYRLLSFPKPAILASLTVIVIFFVLFLSRFSPGGEAKYVKDYFRGL